MNKENKPSIEDIKKKADELKIYYSKLISLYSIKDDLVFTDDKDSKLAVLLNNQLEGYDKKFNPLFDSMKDAFIIHKEIVRAEEYLNQVVGGGSTTRIKTIENILADANLKSLSDKSNQIIASYDEIIHSEHGNIIDNIKIHGEEIDILYSNFFFTSGNETKAVMLEKIYKELTEKHEELITGNDTTESVAKQMSDNHLDFKLKQGELSSFYKKIFGSKDEKIVSLK